MSSQQESSGLQSRRNGIIRSVLWVAFFAVLAWLVVASWGLSFWPSVALFTVYTVGIAIPLGLTLGLLIPGGLAARRERAGRQSPHRDTLDTNA
jgi:magnesium-transporting ATPase (P-type)